MRKIINYEKKKDISNINFNERFYLYKKFLKYLENPQNKIKSIIITGSSGKGSTALFLSAILKNSNLRVGIYTSPHIITERERIMINFEMIKKNRFISLKKIVLKKLNEFNNKFNLKYDISYFELMTIIGFLYFLENKIDYAILEVGLGGRWDAVNVGNPLVSVITSVCKDHTNLLGNSLKLILNEKMQIIRNNSTAVVGITKKKLISMLDYYCKKKNSILFCIDKDFKVKLLKVDIKNIVFKYNNTVFRVPLYSVDIIKSIGIAIFISEKLIGFSKDLIQSAIESFYIPGRFQIIKKENKTIIVDSGHNLCAVKSFIKTVKLINMSGGILIFTIMQDKEADIILKNLSIISKKIILYRLNIEREYDKQKLKQLAEKYFDKVMIVETKEVLNRIIKKEKIVYMFGSFYMTGTLFRDVEV